MFHSLSVAMFNLSDLLCATSVSALLLKGYVRPGQGTAPGAHGVCCCAEDANNHWLCFVFYLLLSSWLQNAEASDDDEEGKALMTKPGPSSAKEEKENEVFFKKVDFIPTCILMNMHINGYITFAWKFRSICTSYLFLG